MLCGNSREDLTHNAFYFLQVSTLKNVMVDYFSIHHLKTIICIYNLSVTIPRDVEMVEYTKKGITLSRGKDILYMENRGK